MGRRGEIVIHNRADCIRGLVGRTADITTAHANNLLNAIASTYRDVTIIEMEVSRNFMEDGIFHIIFDCSTGSGGLRRLWGHFDANTGRIKNRPRKDKLI